MKASLGAVAIVTFLVLYIAFSGVAARSCQDRGGTYLPRDGVCLRGGLTPLVGVR